MFKVLSCGSSEGDQLSLLNQLPGTCCYVFKLSLHFIKRKRNNKITSLSFFPKTEQLKNNPSENRSNGCTLLLMFLFLCSFIRGQDSAQFSRRKLNFGANLSFTYASEMNDLFLCPGIEINYKKHTLIVGPTFNFDHNQKVEGLKIDYQLNPVSESKHIAFYIQFDNQLNINTSHYLYSYWSGQKKIEVRSSARKTQVLNTIGYGIKLKLINGFYINQSVGIGVLSLKQDDRSDKPGFTHQSYMGAEPVIYVKLGIGYLLHKRTRDNFPD